MFDNVVNFVFQTEKGNLVHMEKPSFQICVDLIINEYIKDFLSLNFAVDCG